MPVVLTGGMPKLIPLSSLPPGAARPWLIPLGLLALGLLLFPSASAEQEPDWRTVEETTVFTGLEGPIDLAIAPDGEIWWNELYSGDVVRQAPGEDREVAFHADPIPDPVERGLLGLALGPDILDDETFFVYYTVEDDKGERNHLSRIEDGEEDRLLEVPAAERHNGGRIILDDEGRLFVSTGDNTEGYPAQDPGSLLGKILHIHPNGTPAEDTMEGPVYAIGHRNVYGLAYDEGTDRLFATENNDLERDEVNLVEAGNNHGWPDCQGTKRYDFDRGEPTDEPCHDPEFTPPIGEFYEDYTAAPTGATMFHGDLYWAAWNQGEIHRMVEDPDTGEWHDRVVYKTDGRINDIESYGGALYYANWTSIVRLHNLLPSEEDHLPAGAGVGDGSSGADTASEVPGLGVAVHGLLLAAIVFQRKG